MKNIIILLLLFTASCKKQTFPIVYQIRYDNGEVIYMKNVMNIELPESSKLYKWVNGKYVEILKNK